MSWAHCLPFGRAAENHLRQLKVVGACYRRRDTLYSYLLLPPVPPRARTPWYDDNRKPCPVWFARHPIQAGRWCLSTTEEMDDVSSFFCGFHIQQPQHRLSPVLVTIAIFIAAVLEILYSARSNQLQKITSVSLLLMDNERRHFYLYGPFFIIYFTETPSKNLLIYPLRFCQNKWRWFDVSFEIVGKSMGKVRPILFAYNFTQPNHHYF